MIMSRNIDITTFNERKIKQTKRIRNRYANIFKIRLRIRTKIVLKK